MRPETTDRLPRRVGYVHRHPSKHRAAYRYCGRYSRTDSVRSRSQTDGIMSGPANMTISDRERARAQAKTNLLLALYSHVAHDLEQKRTEADRLNLELGALRGDFEQTHRHLDEVRAEVERVHGQLNQTINERDRLAVRADQVQQQHDAV